MKTFEWELEILEFLAVGVVLVGVGLFSKYPFSSVFWWIGAGIFGVGLTMFGEAYHHFRLSKQEKNLKSD